MNNNWYNTWNGNWGNRLITSEKAVQIALQQVQGQVVKVELDTENGVLVYEVYIRTSSWLYEVKIDANTGMVIKVEIEND